MAVKQLEGGIISEQVAVSVRNVGDQVLRLDYANQRWEIAPGEAKVAPYLAACYWFGDPRAINIGDRRATQYRAQEIDRLSVLYGLYDSSFYNDDPGAETEPIHVDSHRTIGPRPYVNGRHPNLPQVVVTDITSGEQILTIIDDPLNVAGAVEMRDPSTEALHAQVASMQQQLANLTARLAAQDPDAAAEVLSNQPKADFIPGGSPVPTDDEAILEGLAGDDDGDEDFGAEMLADPEPDPSARATVDGSSRHSK